jgi:hypothetical protein
MSLCVVLPACGQALRRCGVRPRPRLTPQGFACLRVAASAKVRTFLSNLLKEKQSEGWVEKFGDNGNKEGQFKKSLQPELRSVGVKEISFPRKCR